MELADVLTVPNVRPLLVTISGKVTSDTNGIFVLKILLVPDKGKNFEVLEVLVNKF